MKVFIGGYTKKTSKGIYQADLTIKDGQASLGNFTNCVELNGPTYFKKCGNYLFSIAKNKDEGGISFFQLNPVKLINSVFQLGASPAYLGINEDKHLVYTANYHTAYLSVYHYDNDGVSLVDQVKHDSFNLGPRPEQKDGAHPHFFDETPSGKLVSCDLGNDSVDFYDLKDGHLVHLARYLNEAGFGSRHIVFNKENNYFYVAGELSSKINVVKYNEKTWEFENIATYRTIPDDYTDHNGVAAIRMSNDGKFLYLSNRGHNSITVFKIKADHTLELVQRISTFGEFPRDFNWDSSEKWVIATNQNTDNATLYERNSEMGTLAVVQKDVAVPEGTCVVFSKE